MERLEKVPEAQTECVGPEHLLMRLDNLKDVHSLGERVWEKVVRQAHTNWVCTE